MTLSLLDFINKMLRKKATWEGLNPKTRKWVARLLVCSLYCLIAALTCAVAVVYEAPKTEVFQFLGLSSVFAWVTLTFLAVASNAAGSVIMRVENYQRHRGNLTEQKYVKRMLFARMPTSCLASYRAGNARARRSPTRSHASKDSSNSGESDSGEGDPPAPPSLPALPLRPHLTFPCLFYKLNSCSFPWCSLFYLGYWCMAFCSTSPGRGWKL